MSRENLTRRRLMLLPDSPHHGTRNGYANLGCRCEPCRAANTKYLRERKANNPATGPRPPEPDLPGEVWKPVVGYIGLYDVSNMGRIRSRARKIRHSSGGSASLKERVGYGHLTEYGYRAFTLSDDTATATRMVHNLVLEAFVGPRPEGYDGCHNNGQGTDNRLVNLRWDTKSANSVDTVIHGTHPQARKTHCPQGHEFTGENTYRTTEGYRRCRTCNPSGGGGNASKSHCKRGHAFTPENTLIRKAGRECRTCAQMHRKNHRLRKAAQS